MTTPLTIAGAVPLDSFPGTWDQRLDAALSYVGSVKGSQRVAPPILVPMGQQIPLTGTRVLPDGAQLINPGVGSIQRGAASIPSDIRYNGATMFVLDHDTFDVTLSGLSVQGNSGGTFFDTRGHVCWESTFRDLGMNGWTSVWGTPTVKFLHTLCTWDGRHNYNNARGTQWNLGGSDSRGPMSRLAMDVGGNAAFQQQFAAANSWLVQFSSSQKGEWHGGYLTCQGAVNGVRVANSATDGRVVLREWALEGRNAWSPCTRDLLRVDSGLVYAYDMALNFAAKPTSVDHGAPVVVSKGAQLHLHGATTARANGTGEDVPLIHVRAGGRLVLRDAAVVNPGSYTDARPRVTVETGASVDCDGSVVVVGV